MPSSFSRFLSEEEMQRVRELHLQSLQDAESDEQPDEEGDTAESDAK
ncbi:hypothetical protein ACWF9B_03000 [Streptomyces sp. NPDC055089]